MNEELIAAAKAALDSEIARIKEMPADSVFVQANQALISGSTTDLSSYLGGGLLDVYGALFYSVGCTLYLAGSTSYGINFSASGTSWKAFDASECEVGGYFVVDPSTIAGPCQYTLGLVNVAEGMVSLVLYSDQGTLYGNFIGNADGVGFVALSGTGTLTVVGTN